MKWCLALMMTLTLITSSQAQASPRDTVLGLINEHRVTHGCDKLLPAGQHLLRSARAHSRKMASRGVIFHTQLKIDDWSVVGEVVGFASRWRIIVDLLFQSSEHRHILLDCQYDKISIGIYFDDNGDVWLTGRLYAN